MRFFLSKYLLFPVLVLLLAGCARPKNTVAKAGKSAKTNQVTVTLAATASGRVAMVNKASRFAVLGYAIGSEPPVGQKLNAYRDGLKVAELKVTGPQSEGNTVADITAGEVQVDDEVRED